MRKFVCQECGKASYSSAALEYQKHPECIYCNAMACKEVPMTREDIMGSSGSLEHDESEAEVLQAMKRDFLNKFEGGKVNG